MHHLRPRTPRRRGYTLVEVLVVVVIMGVVGAIVVPELLSAGTLGVQAAVRAIVADVMFAQNEAMAQQEPRRVVFEPDADRYRVTDGAGSTLSVAWMAGSASNYVVDFGSDSRFTGVEIVSANFGGDTALEFDDLGGPLTGGEVVVRFNEDAYRISVAPFTGRITVARF